MPLATIVYSELEANQMIDAQALKIALGNYTAAEKERLNAIIAGLRSGGKIGHIEVVGFPGFFTTKSKSYLTRLGYR